MKWKLVIDAFNKEKVQIEAFSKYCENDLEILLPPLTPTGGRFLFSRPGNIATASSGLVSRDRSSRCIDRFGLGPGDESDTEQPLLSTIIILLSDDTSFNQHYAPHC